MEALHELWELSRPEQPTSTIVFIPLHIHRVERGSIWVLRPNCKTRKDSRVPATLPGGLLPPNRGNTQEQVYYHTHTRSQYSRPCKCLPSCNQLPKTMRHISLCRGHSTQGHCTTNQRNYREGWGAGPLLKAVEILQGGRYQ